MSSGIHNGGQAMRTARRLLLERYTRYGLELACRRCGQAIDRTLPSRHPSGLGLTIGHVIPVKHGGSDAQGNLAPEHLRCNLAAGARPISPRASIARPVGGWDGTEADPRIVAGEER